MQDLFSKLGIQIKSNALDQTLIARIMAEIHAGLAKDDTIFKDITARKTYKTQLSQALIDDILQLLEAEILPDLRVFFELPLQVTLPMQALYYDKGHFFKPHRDDTKTDDGKDYKKVTLVFFLNEYGKQEDTGDYGGGLLNLYGLIQKFPNRSFPIPNTCGTMVAFRSDTIHEVTEVAWGHRCTLVAWLI